MNATDYRDNYRPLALPVWLDRGCTGPVHVFIIRDADKRQLCTINPYLPDREIIAERIIAAFNGTN